ncbi:glycoside hydrolase family 127 protein [Fontivita pretiosa]|uniref:glycoside hydrolase family 127 protein n=1 Tax=Fontivita pretiosa TaxID=2989684 RepID=UPI003D1653F6
MSTALIPIEHHRVKFGCGFWGRRVATNRRVTIPHELELLRRTGRIDALRLDWKPGMPNRPHYFWDSDVAKWIEAASYSLATHPDPQLESELNEVIESIASAQQPDGYLNVYFTVVEPQKRWTNLRDWHELYCAGHLIEAAVAHFCATGKRTLLDPLIRYADLIDDTFGPRGKRDGYPGHEQIELALVKLYRVTGQRRYLELSKHFIDRRGQRPHFYDAEARARGEDPKAWEWDYTKNQSHLPVRQQREAVGHAVRATYLYSGMADVAAETNDPELLAACRRLWKSITRRKMYITGGIGAVRRGEAFGDDFELPNETAYCETCAAIGLVFFAHRMLQIDRDAEYADVMERALYNGVISAVSLDGRRFFYENPLASSGQHHRRPWYDCACCPPNVARLLASLGTYVYSTSADGRELYVHLYAAGSAAVSLAGREVRLSQQTDYPWDGRVEIRMDPDQSMDFSLLLRIPGWCRRYGLKLNGQSIAAPVRHGYARICRHWRRGDCVVLSLHMPPERVVSHPRVLDNAGRVALQRGPIVYCLEQCDHSVDIRRIEVSDRARISPVRTRSLGGAVLLRCQATVCQMSEQSDALYRPLDAVRPERKPRRRRMDVTATPYALWDNRKPGRMLVWLGTAG